MIEMAWKVGARCWRCGFPFMTKKDITADHIIPLRNGGSHDLSNLAPAHDGCNKGEKKTKREPKPRRDLKTNEYLDW